MRPSYLHPPRMPILQGTSQKIAGQIGGKVSQWKPNSWTKIHPSPRTNRTTDERQVRLANLDRTLFGVTEVVSIQIHTWKWRLWNNSRKPNAFIGCFFLFVFWNQHRVQKKGEAGNPTFRTQPLMKFHICFRNPTYGLVFWLIFMGS